MDYPGRSLASASFPNRSQTRSEPVSVYTATTGVVPNPSRIRTTAEKSCGLPEAPRNGVPGCAPPSPPPQQKCISLGGQPHSCAAAGPDRTGWPGAAFAPPGRRLLIDVVSGYPVWATRFVYMLIVGVTVGVCW